MGRYLRLLRSPELAAGDERLELEQILNQAPGVSAVEILGYATRGGYGVQFDLSPEDFENFMLYLVKTAWRPVM